MAVPDVLGATRSQIRIVAIEERLPLRHNPGRRASQRQTQLEIEDGLRQLRRISQPETHCRLCPMIFSASSTDLIHRP